MKNRKNIRLQNYDYSQAGYYFVTVCTKDRINYFGEIINGEMELNEAGRITEKCIKEIPEHFSNSDIDYYCIMPNHINLIIIIEDISVGNTHACSLQKPNKILKKNIIFNIKRKTKNEKSNNPTRNFNELHRSQPELLCLQC